MHMQMSLFNEEPVEYSTRQQKRARSQVNKKRNATRQPFLFSQRDMAQVVRTTQCATVRDDPSVAPLHLEMQGTDEAKHHYELEQERSITHGSF